MLKQLLKKQLLEMFQNFFVNKKKNKGRSKVSSTMMVVGYFLFICIVFGALFGFFANSLLPVVDKGYGWMFFCFMGLISVAMGAFGSVFNTYSSLYLSKDNDFLLSLPIPVGSIIASRLLSVYLMGTFYSSLVIIPAAVVYLRHISFGVKPLLGSVLLVIIISFIVMVLACALGWVVAKISTKLKNKSFINVIVSLAFLAIYYVFYFKANTIIRAIIADADAYGKKIKSSAYPLYVFGKVGTGDILSAVIVLVVVAALCALTYYVIAHSFIKIATSSQNTVKKKYVEREAKAKGVSSALLGKEIKRFVSSSNYMLNCGLGTLFLLAAGIFILIKGQWLADNIVDMFDTENVICVIAVGFICLVASMNDISAPSVSLEGKNIWLAQSLPITAWQALKAKLSAHLLITGIPCLFCSLCAVIALRPTVLGAAMIIIAPEIFILFFAMLGLTINLKSPNLNWTNEITPIKQSLSIFVCLFGGWIYAILFVVAYMPLSGRISGELYLVGIAALTGLICLALDSWLKKKGTKIFAEL